MIRFLDMFTDVLAAHLQLLSILIEDAKSEHYVRGFADGRRDLETILEWSTDE